MGIFFNCTNYSFRPSARSKHMVPGIRCLRGFGMVELMVTIGVSLILLSLAAPDFRAFLQNPRVKTATEDFVSAMHTARTAAITRGSAIMLCRTGSPGSDPASLACRANQPGGAANGENDWRPGWRMYSKPGYSGSGGGADYDNTTDGIPLLVGNPSASGVAIKSNSDGNRWLPFFGDGTLNEGGAALYAVCDNRGASEGRLITIATVGRPPISQSPSSCNP